MKTRKKLKQIVRVRERILANGDTKFYLDINQKGRKRETETLDLVWLKNPKTKEERLQNETARETVSIIRSRREAELISNKYKVTQTFKSDTYLLVYASILKEERKESLGNYGNWDSMYKHLKKFLKDVDIQMGTINKEWVKSFKEYLRDKCNLESGSSFSYFNKILCLFKQAVKDRILFENPAEGVDRIIPTQTMRTFLNEEEVGLMANADCRYDVLKRAFLFSVLTGLRWSDINLLTWGNVDKDFERVAIRGSQKKTDDFYGVPLNEDAIKLMGERGNSSDRVFSGLRYSAYMNVAITKWTANAGLQKHVTFHSARHSYAYLLLKENVNIYTISKLLGHTHIKSTERYLHLFDMDKREAVEKLPKLNFKLSISTKPIGIQYETKRIA
jgi:integrase